jgi:hypothetical protein
VWQLKLEGEMDRLDHYSDHALTEHEFQQYCWKRSSGPIFQNYTVWCVNDQLYLDNYRYLPVKFAMQYTVGGMEGHQPVLIDTNDIPWLPVDPRRIKRREELRSFVASEITAMREHHAKLNQLLVSAGLPTMILDPAHPPEGFGWDVDRYPEQQTRRWNPETRMLEDGKDPPFVAPTPVPFDEPVVAEQYTPFEGL